MTEDTATIDEPAGTVDRLRRTLSAVASATSVPDRSAELRARLDRRATGSSGPPLAPTTEPVGPAPNPTTDRDTVAGDGPDTGTARRGTRPAAADNMPPRSVAGTADREPPVVRDSRAHPARGRRFLAVAATLVLIALGAVVARQATRERPPEVTTTPGPAGTGWYLPPDGWEVTSVQTDLLNVAPYGSCPCTLWTAGRPGQDPATLEVKESGPATAPEEPGDPIDVDGRPGTLSSFDAIEVLVVKGDQRLTIVAGGVARNDLLALADAWLDRRERGADVDPADLPLPDGFERTAVVGRPAVGDEHLLVVRAREAATGREVEYQLLPYGQSLAALAGGAGVGLRSLRFDDGTFRGSTRAGDGQDQPVVMLTDGLVTIVAGPSYFGGPVEPLSPEALDAFVDGLHEVSTSRWRAALAGADGEVDGEVDEKVLEAVTLDGPPLVEP